MREYKFRLWDKEKEIMLDVEKIDFDDCYYGGEMYVNTTNGSDYWNNELYSLMQYTGLHDENGKEIYEGDIVKFRFKTDRDVYPDIVGYIEYQSTFSAFKIMSWQGSFKIDITEFKFVKVIGNIYENKELLNETNR